MTAAISVAPPTPKLWTRRVVLVLSVQAMFGLGWSAYLVEPKFLATALGANPDQIARVMLMSPFASVCMVPATVALMDRVSRVWLFRVGLLSLIGASIGYTTVHTLTPLLYLLQAGVGISYALAYNSSAAIIADEAPRERIGEAIGLLGASNVMTNAFATTLAEHLAGRFGWKTALETSLGLAVLALVVSSRVKDRRRPTHEARDVSVLPYLRGPLGRVLVCSALTGAVFSAMFTFHQPYVLKLGGKAVSPFFVGFTTTAVAVRVLFGSLGDRLGHRRVSMVAMIAYGLVALATAWLKVDCLVLYGLGLGAAHGVLYPTLNTHGVHAAPDGTRGRVIALYGGSFNVGTAIATLTWGRVASTLGFPAVFIFASLAAFTGAFVLSTRGARLPADGVPPARA